MLSRELMKSIEPRNRVLLAIWIAMIVACFVYVAAAFLVIDRPVGDQLDGRGWALLDVIFPVVAVVLASGALLYQRAALSEAALLRQLSRTAQISVSQVVAPGAEEADEEPWARPATEQRLMDLVPLYQNTKVVIWALLEAICVLGLVMAFLRGTPLTALPYAGVAVVLLVLTRPDLTRFLAQTQALARRQL
jgi:hypothetical protein